jgi:pimeloyl-ACP methyl ester carboxylesterase
MKDEEIGSSWGSHARNASMLDGSVYERYEAALPIDGVTHLDGIEPVQEGKLKLGDGRSLGFAEYGARDGFPVVYCHGFPGSRLEAALSHKAAQEVGARMIAFDRPGYGLSDIGENRTILDWAEDVAFATGELGISRFAVVGISGGCPYALACAHLLPSRVSNVGIVCGLGPFDTPEVRLALKGLGRAAAFIGWHIPRIFAPLYGQCVNFVARRRPGYTFDLLTLTSCEPDRLLMQRPDVYNIVVASIHEALRSGAESIIQDVHNLVRPWGFALKDIAAPVHLWHGECDATVPVSIGRHIAERLRICHPSFVPGEGHFSLPVNHAGPILRTLIAPASAIAA